MKKILTSFLMIGLVFCLGGCEFPWAKKTDDTQQEVKKETIEANVVKDSMKGMTLDVGISNEMAPFCYYDKEEKKHVGFDMDILEQISDYLGFEYKTHALPMRTISERIKSGKLDFAIAGISITDDRQREYSFTDTYFENTIKIAVNEATGITDRKDLVGKVIGVEKGTSNASYVDDYLKENNTVKYYDSMDDVFKRLENGKIDATLYDTTGIDYYLKNHPDTKVVVLGEELNSEESNYGIMFQKGYKYVDQFNVALQVLNGNGQYQTMREKWINTK